MKQQSRPAHLWGRSTNTHAGSTASRPTAAPVPDACTEVRNTTCYMCACRCGIRVHLRNGEVRYIEGNPITRSTAA